MSGRFGLRRDAAAPAGSGAMGWLWEADFFVKNMLQQEGWHAPVFALVAGCALLTAVGASLALLVAARSVPEAACVVRKLVMIKDGALQMMLSKDKKWAKLPDAADARIPPGARCKTIIYIRHGESDWNEVFNRGFGADFPGRLFAALVRELRLLVTGDSVFFDSSLSDTGIAQSLELADALRDDASTGTSDTLKILAGKGSLPSVVTCSNLRRSMETALIGLTKRFELTEEPLHVLTALQEVTVNVDGIPLAEKHAVPEFGANVAQYFPKSFKSSNPSGSFDVSMNTGNKPVDSNGLKRMMSFLAWAFERPEACIVVAGGHSLYFRFLMRTFLPGSSTFQGKSRKLSNAGVVRFDMYEGELGAGSSPAQRMYVIDEQSLQVAFGGFQ
ncbi:hypothetical protein FVE85_2451 [Porphyridium purpureum]|uniref:Uncharacterized protein n=1 Tax=Porphyridium purpureum TaxID=35688 RepID=A0A5J4YJ50_PORPP|nr:hypothetical protein FVE85_2451 [Porphyridium purpureum]|eukprot:POR2715..scf291_13